MRPILFFATLPNQNWVGICSLPGMGSNTEGGSWDRVEMDCILEKQVAVHSLSSAFLSISV